MKNWRTNLGGAISITGTALIGIGLVTTQIEVPSKVVIYTTVIGFLLSALGKGLTALFAADAVEVKNIAIAVDKINTQGSDPNAVPSSVSQPLPPPK